MKSSFSLLILSVTILTLNSCKKKDKETMPQYTGSITGIFAAGAPAGMYATTINPLTDAVMIAKPDANGKFTFSALPTGTYYISLGFPDRTVYPNVGGYDVKQQENYDIGTFHFTGSSLSNITGTGTLSTKISPLNSSKSIWIYNENLRAGYLGTIDASGNAVITGLPYGSYTINPIAAKGFTLVDGQSLKQMIGSGKNVDYGTIRFTDNADPVSPNFISYDVDGTNFTRELIVGADYNGDALNLYTYSNGTQTNAFGDFKVVLMTKLELHLKDVTTTGTYTCSGAGNSIKYQYRKPSSNTTTLGIWSTAGTGGTGTVTITAINKTDRTLSGTFTATLISEGASKSTKTITNGSFANYKY